MEAKTPNARFLVFVNDNLVKITLKPGQELSWFKSWDHDEGWSSESCTWKHEHEYVNYQHECDGVDCDGRFSHYSECCCDINSLASVPNYYGDLMPNWESEESYQHDYYAEQMGY